MNYKCIDGGDVSPFAMRFSGLMNSPQDGGLHTSPLGLWPAVTAGCSTASRSLANTMKGWLLRAGWEGDLYLVQRSELAEVASGY